MCNVDPSRVDSVTCCHTEFVDTFVDTFTVTLCRIRIPKGEAQQLRFEGSPLPPPHNESLQNLVCYGPLSV